MTPAQLAAIKTELATAPYAGLSDEAAADKINTTVRTVNRETLDGGLLVASIVRSEFAALSAGDKQYVQLIAMASSIPLTATLKTELGAVFPNPSQTRTNLLALLTRSGTRAEELGLGRVTPSDVADAKRS